VAVSATGFVASITVVPLAGQDLSRSTALSGIPWATATLGTGVSAMLLSQLMARRGRAPGLLWGYGAGSIGALTAALAIAAGSFALFVAGVLLMGAGNASNQLSRYAAADLYPAERRASGLSLVVWAGTVGGVAGPALLAPTGRAAEASGLPRLTGPFAMAAAGFVLAGLVVALLVRAAPGALRALDADATVPSGRSLIEMWRVPQAQVALIALAVAQAVMVLIMALTPLHMRMFGQGLGSIGLVISAHVFGMYGLSPISGRLTDALGPVRMVLAGFAVIAMAAVGAAAAPEHAGAWLAIPLFALGLGWSLSFVAGSALLTRGLSYADRARLQGATDSVVWLAAAAAGFGSGVLVGAFGYALLCVAGAALVAVPVVMITGRRRILTAPAV
jgi:MFS family permease